MKIERTILLLFFLLLVSNIFSQTKVQALFDAKKYEKCIKLCEKNIKENTDKLPSLLYKSLALIEVYDNKNIIKRYPNPVYEALKGVKRLETYKERKPEDKFYSGNKRKIKIVVDKALILADTFFNQCEFKRSSKIYKKLIEIYPHDKIYFFKIAKVYDFKTKNILSQLSRFSEKEYHENIYEVVSNSSKYLKKTGKYELEEALEKLYLQENCDLETLSTCLVFLKDNYASSDKADILSKKFQAKYWQIEMLIKVNEKRKSGYTCGGEEMKQKPPLILDNCLTRTAQKYAELINKENHFSHTGPDGKSPWTRAREEGCSADGENIALGSGTVFGALNQWMNSSGHCKNIMGYHTRMGIGEAGSYWVQMFR